MRVGRRVKEKRARRRKPVEVEVREGGEGKVSSLSSQIDREKTDAARARERKEHFDLVLR